MGERNGAWRRYLAMASVLACVALAPTEATAATVVNGDFETGNLQGWGASYVTGFGNWYAYKGTTAPIQDDQGKRSPAPVPAPPQGNFAAISDQLNPDTLVLYQDINLVAGAKHQLSLQTFYSSRNPLAVPTPETLSTDEAVIGKQPNQQYRIDLMRPEAALESIDPADVLRTIFRTAAGDPVSMPPTRISANISALAGQTVRLRVAVAAGKEALNAGIDAVSVTTTPLSGPGSDAGTGGKTGKAGKGGDGAGTRLRVLGRAKSLPDGSAKLRVQLPDAGRLTAKRGKLLVPKSVKVARAKTVTLRLKPTAKALRMLRRGNQLDLKVALAFTPRGAATQKATAPVRLKLKNLRRP
jgi:hypothetical protein